MAPPVHALGDLGGELRRAQRRANVVLRVDLVGAWVALGNLDRRGANDPRDIALQVSHPGLARVPVDNDLDGLVADAQRLLADAVLFQLLGDEVMAGDGGLFPARIARDLQHFHAVLERRGNGVGHVGGGDEHHPG